MRRREFLLGSIAGAVTTLVAAAEPLNTPVGMLFDFQRSNGPLIIDEVELIHLEGHHTVDIGIDDQYQVKGEYIYDDMRPPEYVEHPGQMRTVPVSSTYVRLRTRQGLDGLFGPIDGDAPLVLGHFRKFLLGRNALAQETLWDEMYRSAPFGRDGAQCMAISSIDNAIWDLRGKYYGIPVYALLGGPGRQTVEAYASNLNYSVQPDALRRRAEINKQNGYTKQKWFIPYGPGSGEDGLKKNIEMVQILRETVGDYDDLMFDAFNGWTLSYALEWARRAEPYHPRWIEEIVTTDKLDAFQTLRRSTNIPVATGEHFFGRWDAAKFLEAGAISIIQADPDWCGGISELVKIGTLASVYEIPVVPHGHGVHAALHTIFSQSPASFPFAEYLLAPPKMPTYYFFEKHPPEPLRAHFALPAGTGFNIEFDPAKVEKQTVVAAG
ncbi:enolase C-terminal domain-like protein [Paracidobacterium acidisoli]|uniref:Mandelate racemase n=1 Tax=Paracidobacterium acidisoli TaxID=2303751 RepID=A0A372IQB3_9BACT|nr:enolase C-terminal domain-like protein [Paracidobacterium acidisoli]MBT9331035.1 mandelate racemase [Paracidobacterium acidisoli]